MTEFEKWKIYYNKGWASKEQLQTVVQFNRLTAEEYEAITGEALPTA